MKEIAPRWKVGDTITYKHLEDCRGKRYRHGGKDQGGSKGIITAYGYYNPTPDCYNIQVTTRNDGVYSMYEHEFVEWATSTPVIEDNYETF